MNRPRLILGLKLAVSAFFGLLFVLLIVLWVKSYLGPMAYVVHTEQQTTCVLSQGHQVKLETFNMAGFSKLERLSSRTQIEIEVMIYERYGRRMRGFGGNSFGFRWSGWNSVIPYWLPVLLAGILAATPWIRWKFSLRSLLVAITLIAVLLGLARTFGR